MVSVFTCPDVNTREVGRTLDKHREQRHEVSKKHMFANAFFFFFDQVLNSLGNRHDRICFFKTRAMPHLLVIETTENDDLFKTTEFTSNHQ